MHVSERNIWRVGQRIRATVERRLPDGRYLVRSNGSEWIAESTLELKEGQVVEGRVSRLDPRPTLTLTWAGDQPAGNESKECGFSRALFSVEGEKLEVLFAVWKTNARSRGRVEVQRLSMVVRHHELGLVGVDISLIGRYVNVEFKCPSLELAELMQEGSLVLERELNSHKMILGTFAASLWRNPREVDEFLGRRPAYEKIDWVT